MEPDDYSPAWGPTPDTYAEDYGDEKTPCGCPYCPCGETTENGEVCSSCLSGAHQG